MKKITVIYHSADFDGLFCREIAKKFLGDSAEYIGWDFADAPLSPARFTLGQTIYILDLPIDKVFAFTFGSSLMQTLTSGVIWIDHHKSSIETHPAEIPGYRIDGVAACRLAWQWFGEFQCAPPRTTACNTMPTKQDFIDRKVREPYAVQLAGEYDIWDHRNPDAKVFQFGLRSRDLSVENWKWLLTVRDNMKQGEYGGVGVGVGGLTVRDNMKQGEYELAKTNSIITELLDDGRLLQRYQRETDAAIVTKLGFVVEFEGLKFLALNTTARNSQAFEAKDVPETGHDALMKFNFTGEKWDVSLYHAQHRTDLDLSAIAVKHGGGGHKGACGFRAASLPFIK